MGHTPRIRLVDPGEYASLREVRLAALAYSPHLADIHAREGAEAAGFWVDRAARGAAGIEMATFVALDPDRSPFVGVVDGFLSPDGNTVKIGGMWVAPEVRRTGVGHALLTAVCAWATERGAQHAELWVRAENTPARLLYERAGFEASAIPKTASGCRFERPLEPNS